MRTSKYWKKRTPALLKRVSLGSCWAANRFVLARLKYVEDLTIHDGTTSCELKWKKRFKKLFSKCQHVKRFSLEAILPNSKYLNHAMSALATSIVHLSYVYRYVYSPAVLLRSKSCAGFKIALIRMIPDRNSFKPLLIVCPIFKASTSRTFTCLPGTNRRFFLSKGLVASNSTINRIQCCQIWIPLESSNPFFLRALGRI
jgi:hypothetical protein